MKTDQEKTECLINFPSEIISKFASYLDYSDASSLALCSLETREIVSHSPIKIKNQNASQLPFKGTYLEVHTLLKEKTEKKERLNQVKFIQNFVSQKLDEDRDVFTGWVAGLSAGVGGGGFSIYAAIKYFNLPLPISILVGVIIFGTGILIGRKLGFFCADKAKQYDEEKQQITKEIEEISIFLGRN